MVRGFFNLFSPGRMVLAVSFVVIVYLLIGAGGSAVNYFQLADEEEVLRRQVLEQHRLERELEQIREYLRTDEYVEFMARRVFGLVKPGEKLVIVKAPPAEDADVPREEGRRWWQDLFGR